MKRRFWISLFVLSFLVVASTLGYRICTNLNHEVRLATIKKDLISIEKQSSEADPWPFIRELESLKLSPRQLGSRYETILKGLALKKAAYYTENIEANLHERAYQKAHENLFLLKKLLLVFGNPEEVFPVYACLETAYRDHQWNYPTEEEEPAFRWRIPPPSRLCTTDPSL